MLWKHFNISSLPYIYINDFNICSCSRHYLRAFINEASRPYFYVQNSKTSFWFAVDNTPYLYITILYTFPARPESAGAGDIHVRGRPDSQALLQEQAHNRPTKWSDTKHKDAVMQLLLLLLSIIRILPTLYPNTSSPSRRPSSGTIKWTSAYHCLSTISCTCVFGYLGLAYITCQGSRVWNASLHQHDGFWKIFRNIGAVLQCFIHFYRVWLRYPDGQHRKASTGSVSLKHSASV